MGIDRNKATALGLSATIATGFFFQLSPFSQGLFGLETGEEEDESAIVALYFAIALVVIYSNIYIYKDDLEKAFGKLRDLWKDEKVFFIGVGFLALAAAILVAVAASKSAEDSAKALEFDQEAIVPMGIAIASILTIASLLLPLNSVFALYDNWRPKDKTTQTRSWRPIWEVLYNNSLHEPKADKIIAQSASTPNLNIVPNLADYKSASQISSTFKYVTVSFSFLALIGQISTIMSQKILANEVLGKDPDIEISLIALALIAVFFRTPMNTRNAAAGLRLMQKTWNGDNPFFQTDAQISSAGLTPKHTEQARKIASYGSLFGFFVNALINGAMSFFGLPAFIDMLSDFIESFWAEGHHESSEYDESDPFNTPIQELEVPIDDNDQPKDNSYIPQTDPVHLTLHVVGGATGFFNSWAGSSRNLYKKDVITYLSIQTENQEQKSKAPQSQ